MIFVRQNTMNGIDIIRQNRIRQYIKLQQNTHNKIGVANQIKVIWPNPSGKIQENKCLPLNRVRLIDFHLSGREFTVGGKQIRKCIAVIGNSWRRVLVTINMKKTKH